MGMVHYAEKTVFTAGKNSGEKENKEDQVDEAWKPKISLVSTEYCSLYPTQRSVETQN
jgi:hypothetical protein